MKTSILKTLVLAATMIGAASIASAETVHATIPFEFMANGVAMPAGAYSVSTVSGSSTVLLFENEATKAKALAFARTISSPAGKSAFAIKIATVTYEMSKDAASLKGALLAVTPAK
ncbi:MAG: hypothetical protein ABIR70_22505 [Bryobacteraceae bacterium]